MGSSERSLSQDTVFDILSNPRRRYVLYHLRQADGPVQLTKLAEHVAAWENEIDVESLEDQQRKRVYVSLYQTHVPKLHDAGLVVYDKEEGTVELAPESNAIDEYLTNSDDDIPWQTIYVTEALLGAVVLALTIFEVPVIGAIPELVVSLGIVLAFGITAGAQFVTSRNNQTVPNELSRR